MYKKGTLITLGIDGITFPDIGLVNIGEFTIEVKGALPGETVSARVIKRRGSKITAKLISVIETSPYETEAACPHFGLCGGCCFQHVPYKKQLELKESMVLSLFEKNKIDIDGYRGITGSPDIFGYRNKMEFSFGDTGVLGELSLGLRKKNSHYEVVHVTGCRLVTDAVSAALDKTLQYFRELKFPFYNTRRREGVLRHLVVRESKYNGSLLINLVTTSGADKPAIEGFKDAILSLGLNLAGILHTVNDSFADTVKLDDTRILYGNGYFFEEVLGLRFKITPSSFFQTNTLGAEVLYKTVLDFADDCATAYDLYCGTGTITQILSKRVERAIGVEIVTDAVLSAIETAKANGITNVEFICGDVLEIIGGLDKSPDLIVADPPREGIHPKALKIIGAAEAKKIIYVSCKPTSLVRDLKTLSEFGYRVSGMAIVDMFAGCGHVETVVELTK